MQPGQMDRDITIQSKTVSVDGEGNITQTWVDESPVIWASKADQGGREFRAAGTVVAECTTIWTMYFLDTITADKRIKYGSQIYEIVAPPSEMGRRRMMSVQTKFLGFTESAPVPPESFIDLDGEILVDPDGESLVDIS